jgi:hypothetical protein
MQDWPLLRGLCLKNSTLLARRIEERPTPTIHAREQAEAAATEITAAKR